MLTAAFAPYSTMWCLPIGVTVLACAPSTPSGAASTMPHLAADLELVEGVVGDAVLVKIDLLAVRRWRQSRNPGTAAPPCRDPGAVVGLDVAAHPPRD